jgi:transcription elongation factor Elf1
MSIIIRLFIFIAIVSGGIYAFRRLNKPKNKQISTPWCLRCESTRSVVMNFDENQKNGYWYCTRCNEKI